MAKPYMTMGNFNKLESARQEAKRIVASGKITSLIEDDTIGLLDEQIYPGMLPIYLRRDGIGKFVAMLLIDKTDLTVLESENATTSVSAALAINQTEIDELEKERVKVNIEEAETKRGYPDWRFKELQAYNMDELKKALKELISTNL